MTERDWYVLALGSVIGAIPTFLFTSWVYFRQARRARGIAMTLVNEACRHKGGKISPHVVQWAAKALGVVE